MAKKVLYIEDDPINRILVRRLLTTEGFDFYEAENGLIGVEKSAEVVPDLILMDMQMPGLDGYEATKKIKASMGENPIPIVALTAHALQGDRERCIAAGCDGFITKPIDVKNFTTQIEQFL